MFCIFSQKFKERLNIFAAVFICNKKRKEGEKGFDFYAGGTFPTTLSTVFFLPLLNLSYVSSRDRVGINPKPSHEIDSSISMDLIVHHHKLLIVIV